MSREPTTPRKRYKGLLCSSDLHTYPSTLSQDASWAPLSLEKQNALWAWDPRQRCVKSTHLNSRLWTHGPFSMGQSQQGGHSHWLLPQHVPRCLGSVPPHALSVVPAVRAQYFLTEPKHKDMHTAKPADRQTDVGLTACTMSTML